jgi:hypothetical protein
MITSRSLLPVIGLVLTALLFEVPASEPSAAAVPARSAGLADPSATQAVTPVPPKRLTLSPGKAEVGAEIEATAEGLPAGKTVNLIWMTVNGGWVIKDYYHFGGKKYKDAHWTIGQARVGPDGRLVTHFNVPEDYGGVHDILVSADGVTLAQGGIDVTQSFEMAPSEGPVGTLIEIHAKGLGWRTMESTRVLNWDNHEVGWISAADTRGTATARFRATGPVGDHIVKLYTGYMGQSYLNYEQAPTAYLPRPEWVFHTTPGGGVASSYAEPYAPQPVPPSESDIGAGLSINPTQGPVSTDAHLTGSGFPADRTLSLVWETQVGSRVTEAGFAPREKDLGTVTPNADGSLDTPVTIPDDLGGRHALVLKAGDKELARTYFAIETSIVSISPTSGPAGTPVTIHLKGVGWTEYDNIYVATYDNAYMGYACGFNSQGDVVIHFTASGTPGIHLIDLYPGVYKGPKQGQQLYRLPQLTYADDHPGNKIPALRFAFEVTNPASQTQ